MQLRQYRDCYEAQLKDYYLTDDHLYFTGDPVEQVKLAASDVNRTCMVLTADGNIVTFFVLDSGSDAERFSERSDTLLIRAFSTDSRFTGRGYAKAALRQLPEFAAVNFPCVSELVLGVNIRNPSARQLYRQTGFIDRGRRIMGPKGELIVMHYGLAAVNSSV